jgi:hypothetical protein
MSKVKTIKPLLGFHKTSDADLLKLLHAVHDSMKGNPLYPTPPVDLDKFKTEIDSFSVLVTDAADGGKKAKTAKDKQRAVVVKMVTLLGDYVKAACNNDPAAFHTSGFVAAAGTRTPPGPLSGASIEWIDRGPATGSVVLKPKSLSGAVSQEARYGISVNGAAPSTWTTVPLPSPKKTIISNLTPGSTYAFQVRALGKLGYTDWSDSMTFICG